MQIKKISIHKEIILQNYLKKKKHTNIKTKQNTKYKIQKRPFWNDNRNDASFRIRRFQNSQRVPRINEAVA